MLTGLLLTFANIVVCDKTYRKEKIPTAVVWSIVFWCLGLYVCTELLSIPKWITKNGIGIWWLVYDAAQLIFLLLHLYKTRKKLTVNICRGKRLICAVFAVVAMFIIILAVRTNTYNSDSMVYHLARIEHWRNNRSVEHYATDNWRALSSTPFAEFVGLHLYVLSDGLDQLINLVQATSYIVICYLLYHVAIKLGCNWKSAVLSSIIFAATPIAIVEASTTQNDEFAAMWLVFFIYEILSIKKDVRLLECQQGGVVRCIVLALTVGFGYLAKPTIFPAMAIFTVWLLISLLREKIPLKRLATWFIGTGFGALITILPEISRNIITYHSISYYGVGARQIVGTVKPTYLLVNFLKNLCMNLPSIYWPNVYWRFETAVYKLAEILNVSINDPAIAETGVAFKISRAPDYGCDTAVCFVVLLLIILSSIFCLLEFFWGLFRKSKKQNFQKIEGYSTASFLSFYVLLLIMRWEPYVNRYMLGYFAVATPAIVLQMERMCRKFRNKQWINGIIFGGILTISGVEFLNCADAVRLHTEEGREKGIVASYFENGKDKQTAYQQAVDLIQEYETVGLKLDAGCMEYPLLRLIRENGQYYQSINVEGEASKYEDDEYHPDCILYIGEGLGAPSKPYTCHGLEYKKIIQISESCYVIER